jgi:hypothetical protein
MQLRAAEARSGIKSVARLHRARDGTNQLSDDRQRDGLHHPRAASARPPGRPWPSCQVWIAARRRVISGTDVTGRGRRAGHHPDAKFKNSAALLTLIGH